MEKKQSSQKLKTFLKKNVYYIIMGVCLLAIAAMITVSVLMNDSSLLGNNESSEPAVNQNEEQTVNPIVEDEQETTKQEEQTGKEEGGGTVPTEKETEPTETPIVMDAPCANVSILCDYSMDALVWNSTLRHYGVHNGIDFGGEEGTNVLCACDGIVTSVEYDILNGYTVTVKHSESISSSYSSLNEPSVTVGQKLKKGEIIGTMGTTAGREYAEGPHVHFSVTENGKYVDPYQYMTIGGK